MDTEAYIRSQTHHFISLELCLKFRMDWLFFKPLFILLLSEVIMAESVLLLYYRKQEGVPLVVNTYIIFC